MKTIYIIGGTMGVGKTAVCQSLNWCIQKNPIIYHGLMWAAAPEKWLNWH